MEEKIYHYTSVEAFDSMLRKMSESSNPMRLCREFIARVLMEMAPLLKHQSYDYEKEVRLLYHIIRSGEN